MAIVGLFVEARPEIKSRESFHSCPNEIEMELQLALAQDCCTQLLWGCRWLAGIQESGDSAVPARTRSRGRRREGGDSTCLCFAQTERIRGEQGCGEACRSQMVTDYAPMNLKRRRRKIEMESTEGRKPETLQLHLTLLQPKKKRVCRRVPLCSEVERERTQVEEELGIIANVIFFFKAFYLGLIF